MLHRWGDMYTRHPCDVCTILPGIDAQDHWRPYNAAMDFISPIGKRLSHVPPLLVDSAIACALTLFIQLEGAGLMGTDASFRNPSTRAVTALLMSLPLILRRRYPLAVFGLVLFGIVATFTGDVTAHAPMVWMSVIALAIAAYTVGAHSRHGTLSLAVVAATATIIVLAFGGGIPSPPDFAVPYVLLVLPWLVGHALRTRELRADAFQERAIRLEQEQVFATRVAVSEERARIARELHDVVAHNVSVMVVQAGAARSILDPAQEEARAALLSVEASGRAAMNELRSFLGLLSSEGDDMALAPQPGIGQVRQLITSVSQAKLPVELHIQGTPRSLPSGVDLVAYRIVQEALTNALKYADSACTQVILDYREAELKVEVLDEGPGQKLDRNDTTGRGLVGMRERVALYGGRLEAGPRLEGGYGVRAWLPVPVENP